MDIDIVAFVPEFDNVAGRCLERIISTIDEVVTRFEFGGISKAISGPYKPARKLISSPIIFTHIIPLTHEAYLSSLSILTKYCWRKYPCKVDTSFFLTSSPTSIGIEDLMNSKWGVLDIKKYLKSVKYHF